MNSLIQKMLWPVTLVVRAMAREPLRPDYGKIFDLEQEMGLPHAIEFRENLGLKRVDPAVLRSCLEIGLPTTVTQRDLAELKQRTESSADPESPCPHQTWTSPTSPSDARIPSSTPCACGRRWSP